MKVAFIYSDGKDTLSVLICENTLPTRQTRIPRADLVATLADLNLDRVITETPFSEFADSFNPNLNLIHRKP